MFFFFKQKTAYEMRISDWSSDVCSSDLVGALGERVAQVSSPQVVGHRLEPVVGHLRYPFASAQLAPTERLTSSGPQRSAAPAITSLTTALALSISVGGTSRSTPSWTCRIRRLSLPSVTRRSSSCTSTTLHMSAAREKR